jgi:hypothetical protein
MNSTICATVKRFAALSITLIPRDQILFPFFAAILLLSYFFFFHVVHGYQFLCVLCYRHVPEIRPLLENVYALQDIIGYLIRIIPMSNN